TAGGTLMFQGLVDAPVLASLAVAAALIMPNSFVGLTLPYAAAALAFFLAIALWWRWGGGLTKTGRWLHEIPWMYAFRVARLREYLVLGLIRTAIYVPQGFLFYYELVAFGAAAPLEQVLALGPLMLLAAGQPITPAGLGPLQAVMVDGLSQYSPRAEVLAASLGISIMRLLCRLPLGFGAAGTFARKVIQLETSLRDENDERDQGGDQERDDAQDDNQLQDEGKRNGGGTHNQNRRRP
ncbi:MAG: lysylphosphatidylglycerol synthase domain-containing protein, partial [Candidatus Binataceae bacterium]